MRSILRSISAAAARALRRLSAIGFNPGRSGRARRTRPTPSAYSLAIRRELALADYAVAKRRHKRRKTLAKEACSATHDLLRAEVGRG